MEETREGDFADFGFEEEVQKSGKITSGIKDTGRQIARGVARGAESLLGLPGDISEGLSSLVEATARKITGKDLPSAKEVIKKQKRLIPFPEAPTSDDFRKVTKKLTGESLEPQGRGEELSDEIISDLATLYVPFKGRIPFKKTLAQAIGGNLAKMATKEVGVGETGQTVAKLGTMLVIGGLGRPKIKESMDELYFQADSAIPEGATTGAQNLSKTLERLGPKLEVGLGAPSKAKVKEVIGDLQSKILKGKISVDELLASKRDLNEIMGDPSLLTRGRKQLGTLAAELDNAVEAYGKTNPSFIKPYRQANEVFGSLAKAEKLGNFAKAKFGKPSSVTLPILLYYYPQATLSALGDRDWETKTSFAWR